MSKQISCAICAAGMEQGGTCPCCGWKDKGVINLCASWWLLHYSILLYAIAWLNGSLV